MMQPTPPQAPAPPPKAVPTPPSPPPPVKKKAPPLKKKQGKKGLVIFGVIFLLLLSAGGYYALQTIQPVKEKEPTVTPAPTPLPKPIPQPDPPQVLEPEPIPSEPGSPFPQATRPGTDSDSDGLTDIEERLVYQTNPRLPDTDSDGFLDGNEVFHRYNPVALAPGNLLETGLVKVLIPAGEEYGIFYPTVWDAEVNPENLAQYIIQATTGETIRLTLIPKDVNLTLSAWYQQEIEANGVFEVITKNNYSALVTDNQLSYYIDGGEYLIQLEYLTGVKATVDYLQTFQMMINSFELK